MPKNRDREKRIIARRDGPACFYCGRPRHNPLVMTIEHLQAHALGGGNDLANLRLADPLCNKFAGRRTVADKLELRTKWHMAEGL
jgi:5-methylcytosine-specific restriction endonuclease McrA